MIYKTFTKEKEKMKHTKEQIEAAIEAVNEEMSFIGHGFTDNQLKTILATFFFQSVNLWPRKFWVNIIYSYG